MGVSFAAVFMMLLGGGTSDLLDAVHTDSYWKAKQVTVSVEQLIADASGKVDANAAEPAAAKAAAVRRLMAIRTLGEMKEAQGVAALQPLVDSKEPFVGEYAQAAIAAIQGKPVAARPGAAAAARMTDVWLLPAQSDLVAQLAPEGKPKPHGDLLGDTPLPPGMNKAEALAEVTSQLIPIAEQVGNIRVSSVTVGVYSNAPGQPGYGVIVLGGQYDAKAAAAAMAQMNVPMKTIDGQDVHQPEPSVGLIFASDTRAVVVTGDRDGKLPLEDVVAAIKKDAGGLHDNAEITKLIATVDTKQAMWGVVKMTDGLRQIAPPVAAFDSATLVVSQKDDVMTAVLKAEGTDAEKVKASVDEMRKHLDEAISQGRDAVRQMPAVQPMLDALESVKMESDGGKATLTGTLKGSLPMLFFGARADVGPGPARPAKPGGL